MSSRAACACTNQSDWWSERQEAPGEVSIYRFKHTGHFIRVLQHARCTS